MNALHELVSLSEEEKAAKGIVATPGEIAQQPETWKRTRRIYEEHAPALRAFLEAAGVTESLERRPTVMLIGAGTSDYIGHVLQLLLRTEWGCETLVVASTDDPYCLPIRAEQLAGDWGASLCSLGALGHLNAQSGLGDWPQGWALLQALLADRRESIAW